VTDHADLIARLRKWSGHVVLAPALIAMTEAADALAALGDTVPRKLSLADVDGYYVEQGIHTYSEVLQMMEDSDTALDEARAERDALAHAIEQARRVSTPDVQSSWRDRAAEVDAILYASTAESDLARHDAEVKAQALDEAAEVFATGEWSDAFAVGDVEDDVSAVQATTAWFKSRAAAIRAEAEVQ